MKLAEMKPVNIEPKMVFRKSKSILSVKLSEKAVDVLEVKKKVLVDACYSNLTGYTLQRFFGEHDTDPL